VSDSAGRNQYTVLYIIRCRRLPVKKTKKQYEIKTKRVRGGRVKHRSRVLRRTFTEQYAYTSRRFVRRNAFSRNRILSNAIFRSLYWYHSREIRQIGSTRPNMLNTVFSRFRDRQFVRTRTPVELYKVDKYSENVLSPVPLSLSNHNRPISFVVAYRRIYFERA